MLPTKFRFIWQSGFREEEFLEINQSETRIAFGGHVCQRIETKLAFFIKDFPMMLPTKFNKHGHHRPFLFLIGRFLNIRFFVTV
jgi:hypothetical protein